MKLCTMPCMWATKASSQPLARASSMQRSALRLVLEHAVQAAEVEQQAGIGRVLGIDEAQHRMGEVMLADLEQDVRDFEDVPGRRMHGALAGLEGVERRLAGQSRRHGRSAPAWRRPAAGRARAGSAARTAPRLRAVRRCSKWATAWSQRAWRSGCVMTMVRVGGSAGHVRGIGAEPGRPFLACRSRAAPGPPVDHRDRGDSPPRGGEFRPGRQPESSWVAAVRDIQIIFVSRGIHVVAS